MKFTFTKDGKMWRLSQDERVTIHSSKTKMKNAIWNRIFDKRHGLGLIERGTITAEETNEEILTK